MIIQKHQDELDYLEITNAHAKAKVALQGAHIFEYQVANKKPLLWLSDISNFKKSKAIRGGIPICWPWFGAHKSLKEAPNHGFARTSTWKCIHSIDIDAGTTKVILELKDTPESLAIWPHQFTLHLEVIISDTLTLSLKTKNCSKERFEISQALHTYFKVDDITQVHLHGCEKKSYFNKLDDSMNNVQNGVVTFSEETDRIYVNTDNKFVIEDGSREIMIESEGSASTVVWNPWEQRAYEMSDMSDYKEMLCVESANVLADSKVVQPGETHLLKVCYC